MSRSAVRQVLAGLGVAASVAAASAVQQPQAPASSAAAPALAGTWEYNEDASKDDQRNWRRPVSANRPVLNPGDGGVRAGGSDGGVRSPGDNRGWGGGGGYLPRPSSSNFDSELRRALRDLLEVAESYEIDIEPDRVVITDDLDRSFAFSTMGKKDKHRIGATNFEAKTVWDGPMLKQEIEAIGGFQMSQVFFPSADGQTLFVSITVQRPEFTPAIKPITRTYRRPGVPR